MKKPMYNQLTIDTQDKFINCIRCVLPNLRPGKLTKIKDYSHQVVIETDQYFYKVYEDPIETGTFTLEIRKHLAKIYNDLNIHWKIYHFIKDGYIYTIEQRQILPVCTQSISCIELLKRYKKIHDQLEKALRLDYITIQLKEEWHGLENLYKVKLLRDCMNKPDDYGIGPNNEIVLLDDADWILVLIDKEGNTLSYKDLWQKVLTPIGYLTFAQNKENLYKRFTCLDENSSSFYLFDDKELENKCNKLKFLRQAVLEENVKLLNGNCINENAFIYETEFFNTQNKLNNNTISSLMLEDKTI